jgi:hypothetical protein
VSGRRQPQLPGETHSDLGLTSAPRFAGAAPGPDHVDTSVWDQKQVPLPTSGEVVHDVPAKSSHRKLMPEGSMAHEQNAARDVRQTWEASDVGKARMANFQDLHPANANLNSAQVYQGLRETGQYRETGVGPAHWDVQLPGMSDPDAAPRPPKWEELPDHVRANIHEHLAAHGTSLEQITADLGSQHDQAVSRAMGEGVSEPFGTRFYAGKGPGGEPREKLAESAANLGIPELIHGHMTAITSPNTVFAQTTKAGVTSYPNDEAAQHAVMHVQQGGRGAEVDNLMASTGVGGHQPGSERHLTARPANIRRASIAYEQYSQGVAPADWVTSGSGTPFGPKTGPFSNSFSDSHPQFFVSDVHSGGGGAFPHLGTDKPIAYNAAGEMRTDKKGKPVRDKSEREQAIDKVPFAHSAIDYAARQAMQARGIRSTRDFQGGQWGEEQLQRQESAVARGISPGVLPSHESAYGPLRDSTTSTRKITRRDPNQESLF